LFLTYLVFPVLEIYLLIEAGKEFGFWPIFAVVILTAWAGSRLVKMQGFATLNQLQEKMARGQSPHKELSDGVMILVGGVLLIAPGFVTDAFGILLLLPPTRMLFRKILMGWVLRQVSKGRIHVFTQNKGGGFYPPPPSDFYPSSSGMKDVTPSNADSTDPSNPQLK